MNILMMSNTYKPLLGGLEKSVETFANAYREKGHRVIIVAPVIEGAQAEEDVIRIPAVQRFNGTDFAVQLPIPGVLTEALHGFKPEIVHSHHPFLMGDTALRTAYKFNAPLIFTHHTLYEQNTHYVARNSQALKKFVIQLSAGYANLADTVFCPSESVMKILKERGVESPIAVVPTGVELERFDGKGRRRAREEMNLPGDAFVVGHLGRLAPEKNPEFTAEATIQFMNKNKNAHFLLVGKGPSEKDMEAMFGAAGLGARLHLRGPLTGDALTAAYQAMDVFAFASRSETQGLVLAEAMASGTPVVAVDAPGVREIVRDKVNGRLINKENINDFVAALEWVASRSARERGLLRKACLQTAESFSMKKSAERALKIYQALSLNKEFARRPAEDSSWEKALRLIQAHWDIAKNITQATAGALRRK